LKMRVDAEPSRVPQLDNVRAELSTVGDLEGRRKERVTASLGEQLAVALGPTAELERGLGGGGMSRVYLARRPPPRPQHRRGGRPFTGRWV